MATVPVFIPETCPHPRKPAGPVPVRAPFRDLVFQKEIDNSRLYREVNPARRRQCLTLMGAGALAFAFIFCFGWEHFRCVRYGYEIGRLKSQQEQLAVWNQRLRLEQALLADPQRIDRLARADLGLAQPEPQQIVRLKSAGRQPSQPSAPVLARNFAPAARAARGMPREP
ncbi:MAG: cell division protein FtsL [Terriglobia bacterium]